MRHIRLWSLSRAAPGQRRQLDALVESLEGDKALKIKSGIRFRFSHVTVKPGSFFSSIYGWLLGRVPFLPHGILLDSDGGLERVKRAFTGVSLAPDMIISCGRVAGVINLRLREKFNSFAVHLELPSKARAGRVPGFDLVVAPEHDFAGRGNDEEIPENVILTKGALSPFGAPFSVSSASTGRKQHKVHMVHEAIISDCRYRVAVLLGGPLKDSIFNRALTFLLIGCGYRGFTPSELMPDYWLEDLAQRIESVLAEHGGDIKFWVTFSRRTPLRVRDFFNQRFQDEGRVWIWDDEGQNPLAAMLGRASSVWVTGDSVSMISQAVQSTSVPLVIAELMGRIRKLHFFRNGLYGGGEAHKLSETSGGVLVFGKRAPLEQLSKVKKALVGILLGAKPGEGSR